MCINPRRIRDLSTKGRFIDVPCGKCKECQQSRKNKWVVRLLSEASVSDASFFSLISYDDEHLPDPMVADKTALQLLIKRMRASLSDTANLGNLLHRLAIEYNNTKFAKEYNCQIDMSALQKPNVPIELKYFIVSEYGEEKNRLHYHSIWFLKGVNEYIMPWQLWKCFLEYHWKQGFCSSFGLQYQEVAYCTKYMEKQYNMSMYSRLGFDAFKKFRGTEFPVDFENFTVPVFPVRGKPYGLPRSWMEKLKFVKPDGTVFADYLYRRGEFLRNNPPLPLKTDRQRYQEQEKFYLDNPELYAEKVRYKPDIIAINNEFDI